MASQASIAVPALPPVVWAILIPAIAMGPFLLLVWWLNRRDRRRWAREQAERERQWALQQQVWEMERQIWDEQLSDEEREARRQARERAAEVRREARRRLGLPEEEGPS
jgi:hypothetical protein